MINHYKKRFLFFLLLPILVFSQEGANETELDLVILDLLTLSKKFATPGAEAAMHQSSSGWYLSAKEKPLWEIDISFHTNVLFLPNKKQSATISNSDFNSLTIKGGAESAVIPTALGGDTDVFFEGELIGSEFEFQSLEGIDKSQVIYPFLQASVGVPYGTNITLRYLPLVEIRKVEYKVAGIGVQHNINQHFEKLNNLGVQFSGLVGYSRIGVFYPFEPLVLVEDRFMLNKIKINGNLWQFQLIASKEFNDFEIFSALGLTQASFNYKVGGEDEDFISALNNAYERLNASETIFKADLGFNYHFKKFSINSVLSIGEYINANIGLHYKI